MMKFLLKTDKLFIGCYFGLSALFSLAQSGTLPMPDHIIIVFEENRAFTQIIGDTVNAPYINHLADSSALFTQSYALTHPSQPNYIMFFSGSSQGIYDDSYPDGFPYYYTLPFNTPNLGACLIAQGFTFKGFSEDLPSVGFTGVSSGNFVSKHSPWVYWQGTGINHLPDSVNQPFTSFPADYDSLPTLAFVIPDLDNDMHNGTIAQADGWLQTNLDSYIHWADTNNSLFILTFDEDDDLHGNRITTFFYGPMVQKGQYPEIINHYNVLRTIEDMYGLCHAANDSMVSPITDCWIVPDTITSVPGSIMKNAGNEKPFLTVDYTAGTIHFSAASSKYSFALYDAAGKQIFNETISCFSGNSKISKIPTGIYFYVLCPEKTGKIIRGKFPVFGTKSLGHL